MKVAIVTFEFEGLTKNGGIGTSYRRLADLLIEEGHSVDVLFMPFDWARKFQADKKRILREIKSWESKGVRILHPGQQSPRTAAYDGYHLLRSHSVYESLSAGHYDLVHAPDNCGLIYQSLLARKAGLAFKRTRFVIGLHGCPFWTAEANGNFSASAMKLAQLDRESIAMADAVVSPSAYMIDYLRRRDWQLPVHAEVIPNVNQFNAAKEPARLKARTRSVQPTLIFFGRLERRKGIFLFVDAIRRLVAQRGELFVPGPIKIAFVGSDGSHGQLPTITDWIKSELSFWPDKIELDFQCDLTSAQGLEYIARHTNGLVCMPSLVDNSPYTIVEAIESRMNFLATDSGGINELMRPEDAARMLCEPTVEAYAQAIAARLRAEPIVAQPSQLAMSASALWAKLHRQRYFKVERHSQTSKTKRSFDTPKVSIVIGADLRVTSQEFEKTLRSVEQQTYRNIELVVPRGFKFAKSKFKTRYFDGAGKNWNHALQAASGRYVLFLDGATLLHRRTLSDWITASEKARGVESPAAVHGTTLRIETANGSSALQSLNSVFPAPIDLVQVMTGVRVLSAYALFNRKFLLKFAADHTLDFSNDTVVRPVYSEIVAKGQPIVSFPLDVILLLPNRHEPHPHAHDQISVLHTLWRKESGFDVKMTASVAALYADAESFRNQSYQLHARLHELETKAKDVTLGS